MNDNAVPSNKLIINILIVDKNVNFDSDYKNMIKEITSLLDTRKKNGIIQDFLIKTLDNLPEVLGDENIDILVCSGTFKNDLFNRGFINISKLIIVFCANVTYHSEDPNVLSHPEKIKVENNVSSVFKMILNYLDEIDTNIQSNPILYE